MAQMTDKILALARRGDLAALRSLLKADPGLIAAAGPHGRTLLWEAVRFGHETLADFLLEHGAPVDVPGRHRAESHVLLTPLCVSRWRGRDALTARLETHGAKLDAYGAAFLGDFPAVRRFVETDPAVVNRPLPDDTIWKTTPLHFASSGGQWEIASFLCEHGADIALHGPLLLDIAARRGNRALVELFLDRGAIVQSLTAFSVLISENAAELLPILVPRGLDINGDNFGYPALVYAARGDKGEHPEWIEVLLAYGADVNIRDRKGNTALHAAARAGFCKVATVLLNAGADVNTRNSAGRTPLREAQSGNRPQMARLLTSHDGVT